MKPTDLSLVLYVWMRCRLLRLSERGEGVISTAIAVLVMSALGALMWVGFKQLWTNTSAQTANQISQIGQ